MVARGGGERAPGGAFYRRRRRASRPVSLSNDINCAGARSNRTTCGEACSSDSKGMRYNGKCRRTKGSGSSAACGATARTSDATASAGARRVAVAARRAGRYYELERRYVSLGGRKDGQRGCA